MEILALASLPAVAISLSDSRNVSLRIEHRPARSNPWLVQFLRVDGNWMTLSAWPSAEEADAHYATVGGLLDAALREVQPVPS